MHPLIIVFGAALLDIGANMAINRSVGFCDKGWGVLGILLVLCAFTLLSEAVSTMINGCMGLPSSGGWGLVHHGSRPGSP